MWECWPASESASFVTKTTSFLWKASQLINGPLADDSLLRIILSSQQVSCLPFAWKCIYQKSPQLQSYWRAVRKIKSTLVPNSLRTWMQLKLFPHFLVYQQQTWLVFAPILIQKLKIQTQLLWVKPGTSSISIKQNCNSGHTIYTVKRLGTKIMFC